MSDGSVRCRALSNRHGVLGIGTFGEGRRDPVTVPGLCDVEQVVTNWPNDVTCTRHRDGTVRCWGSNRYDMLGTGHDGDSRCESGEPCRTSPALVPGLTDVVDLASNDFSVCAVRRDGSVWCWGDVDRFLPIGGSPTPVLVSEVSNVARLWPCNLGWVARLRTGAYATFLPTSVGPGEVVIPPEAEIDYGTVHFTRHICYRLPDATLRCIGGNSEGQLGNGRSMSSSIAFERTPSDPGLRGVRSVALGTFNACAVLTDRTVQCWGSGESGSLGSGTTERCPGISQPISCATRPVPVPGLDNVDRVFLGWLGGCALGVDHGVRCWGSVLATPDDPTPRLVAW